MDTLSGQFRVLLIAAAVFIAGCGPQPAPTQPPSSQAVGASTQPAPALVINQNGLFFKEAPPEAGEPLDLSIEMLRGRWVAFRAPERNGEDLVPASVFALTFGSGNRPAWTLSDSGTTVDNPNGDVEIQIDGFGMGVVSAAVAWGLDPEKKRGWLASPWEPDGAPFEKTVQFQLVRKDLLRVQGDVFLQTGARVGLDVLLLPVPMDLFFQEPIPSFAFAASEFAPAPLQDDPVIEAESPVLFQGTWIARSPEQTTTLTIADHRLLHIRQRPTGSGEYAHRRLLQFNSAEHALEIMLQDISSSTTGPIDEQGLGPKSAALKLTQQGRLLYFGNSPVQAVVFTREIEDRPEK